jgi:hypothetical protein
LFFYSINVTVLKNSNEILIMGVKPLEIDSTRVNVTLPDALHTIIKRLAAVQGISKSRVILEFLQEVQKPLTDLAEALEIAKNEKRVPIEKLNALASRTIQNVGELGHLMQKLNDDNMELPL